MAPGRNAAQVIFGDLGLDFKVSAQDTADLRIMATARME